MTFEPVTPNISELYVMIHAGDDNALIAEGQGPSPLALTFMTWPAPDANGLGPIWIDPIAQPFHVEGSVTQSVALH